MMGESAGRSAGNEPRSEALRRFEMDERNAVVGLPEDESQDVETHAAIVTHRTSVLLLIVIALIIGMVLGAALAA